MKYLLALLAVVALFAGQAVAADGNVSNDMLAKMGLSNMQTISDAQGTAVRGMGFQGCVSFNVSAFVANMWGASSLAEQCGTVNFDAPFKKTLTVEIKNRADVPGMCGKITAGSCFTLKIY
ncbi:MAG: hypothetical protein JXB10_11525 [Pirellulales bacterium]|nr:hypothetical protein [Pirellulales bacterium]